VDDLVASAVDGDFKGAAEAGVKAITIGVATGVALGELGGAAADAAGATGPKEPYDRAKHYGRTPTQADRNAVGAGPGEVADHDPPLVTRYYEGDPARGEKPGWQQTPQERAASAADRSRMQPQPRPASNAQGGQLRGYSQKQKKANGL
jgi:hypothetical protein